MFLPKIDILGDSITAGYPYLEENIRWWQDLRSIGEPKPLAVTGSGLLYEKGGKNGIIITEKADLSRTDLFVIFMGTNDYGNDMPLGAAEDIFPDKKTVCGALNRIIELIREKNGKTVIAGILPQDRIISEEPPRFGYETKNGCGYTLRTLCDTLKEIYAEKGAFCIDTGKAPINRSTLKALTADGLHPNKKGYQELGRFLYSELYPVICSL